MKLIASIVVSLLLVALVGAAQKNVETDAAATVPVEIVSFEWKYQGYGSGETVEDASDTLSMKSKRKLVYVFKYTARASVRNLSAKTIKAVEWNYVFVDPENRKELKRYKILSKQQIAPDESRPLVKDIFLSLKEDTSHLKTGRHKILLSRIEYTDGSSWRPIERE
ncbi:MAG: hypothetical protein ICV68_07185 [Pyrinomonadaceae bacterium]|nr:hypothetical protein [Pyrinomonadaceae bacterium]